jgi:protein-ribulosamine 3-kinase
LKFKMLITFVPPIMISTPFKIHLQNVFSAKGLADDSIQTFVPVSGGSVNEAYKVELASGNYFLKVNRLDFFPQMFEKEDLGLSLLNNKSLITVPNVLFYGEFENHAYLVMEYIEECDLDKNYWAKFGEGLAQLHQNSSAQFGLDYTNYNGSLAQINSVKSNWTDFFVENRLMEQQRQAYDKGRLDKTLSDQLEKLYPKLEFFFPTEDPSLLHGDLWSGNYLVKNGKPCFMDPAVYYGHREVDIAMSLLFGGFGKEMYEVYNDYFPLEKGWEKRVDVANLYPLMVHVNLFGASYAQRVKSILKHLV